jgi:hypothetical protein
MNNKFVSFISRLLGRIFGFFPSLTPVGLTEFNQWADSIIKTYNPPGNDVSIRFGLSAMLMRLNPTEAYKSKRFFALCLHKGAAAQVAAYVMEQIKEEQLQRQKEEEQAAAAEKLAAQNKMNDASLTPTEVTAVPTKAVPNDGA